MSIYDLFKKAPKALGEASDPICGMRINPDQAQYKTTYQGKIYGFCSQNCKETFDKQIADNNPTPPTKSSCC